MEGEGLGDIINKIKEVASAKSFKTVANLVRKTIKGARPLKDGEYHFLGANFLGPGTRIDLAEVRNTKPLNAPDAVAKQHDLDYFEASKLEDEGERKDAIREADNKMIRALKEMGKLEGIDEVYRKVGLKGIQFKRKVENVSPSFAKQLLPADLLGQKKGGMDDDDDDDDTVDDETSDDDGPVFFPDINRADALYETINTQYATLDEGKEKPRLLPYDVAKKIVKYGREMENAELYNEAFINRINEEEKKYRQQQEENNRRLAEMKKNIEDNRKKFERRQREFERRRRGGAMMMGAGMKDKIISNSRRFNY
jgi:hypothetical protein